ncbi:MAG: hypothetical protein PHP79_10580, partial [Clostridia bacterium]|nr:hypothetical protein [Clostridia bacterium]
AEERVEKLNSQKEELNLERKNLEVFQTKISELINWFDEKNISVNNRLILLSLTATEYTAAQKANGIKAFSVQIQNVRDDRLAVITRLRDETNKNRSM